METTINPTAVLGNQQPATTVTPMQTDSSINNAIEQLHEETHQYPVQPVETVQAAEPVQTKGSAALSLEEALNSELDDFTSKKEQIKKKNKLFREKLMLDPAYHEADDSVKKEQAVRKLAKMKAIANDESLAQLQNEMRELRLDNKMHQMSIQDYLLALEKETGLNTFQSSSGEIIEFEKVAKIKIKA